MVTNKRYIVVFKKGPKSPSRYYGPLVSEPRAIEFMDELPAPDVGGVKTYRSLEPATI